jgi:hypothetical protein
MTFYSLGCVLGAGIFILIGCVAISAVTVEDYVTRIGVKESSNNDKAMGDLDESGLPRSRGRYQIQELPWRKFLGKLPWRIYAHDPKESKPVCRRIVKACIKACKRHGMPTNFHNVYFFYSHGGY